MTNELLDTKDKRLLRSLETNSRQSISQIAKEIGVSKEVANYRLKRLEERGIITGYAAILDKYLLGGTLYRLSINLAGLERGRRNLVVKDLRTAGADVTLFVQGRRDIEARFFAHENTGAEKIIAVLEKHADFIASKQFALIPKVHILRHAYLTGGQEELVLSPGRGAKVDEHEQQLLALLEADPREDLLSLSKKIRLSHSMTHYKVKRLFADGIVKKVVPQVASERLGFTTYRVEVYVGRPSLKGQILQKLVTHPNVVRIYEYLGDADLGFEAEFASAYELDELISSLRSARGDITDVDVLMIRTGWTAEKKGAA